VLFFRRDECKKLSAVDLPHYQQANWLIFHYLQANWLIFLLLPFKNWLIFLLLPFKNWFGQL
jgi:hypothetical protein